ncbi:S-adenosylmethionine-diacylgycerolhomoserine-N-methlytransferase [Cohaesibacter marisflavi]|uniref:S-adenosylmethionine-diacylgycerolhomoserine-N-methlytransferase n=1 Tax=Cohaesibacter marisflavi TaxID=655353 RepID=A0A1I5LN04_9HYPH|nr:class I SAM-dependent methyltransferase [Cohaesibacter marisflavi]SFO98186.1 S-adenosylmethionine-diacylgycerolhomoserine-N-methlytransferase [Cohaesibacter marisflavi]
MACSGETQGNHAGLMDDIYRYQRRIYDISRKYYLLGRDRLIMQMEPAEGAHILEIACGTGRNLDCISRRYPGRSLYGLDISEQMLATARGKLGVRTELAQGDACAFDATSLFGRDGFDHIVMSYSLSMIPDWQGALREALRHLAPGGTLHIVDFGDQARLPKGFRLLLLAWLATFHVTPREALAETLETLSLSLPVNIEHASLFRNYAQIARIHLRL